MMEDGKINSDVWALGDAAVIEDTRLPATAQGAIYEIFCFMHSKPFLSVAVANQQAKYLAKKMNLLAKDKEHNENFEFHNAGSLAYIGNWYSSF